jgi:hypothetical protein
LNRAEEVTLTARIRHSQHRDTDSVEAACNRSIPKGRIHSFVAQSFAALAKFCGFTPLPSRVPHLRFLESGGLQGTASAVPQRSSKCPFPFARFTRARWSLPIYLILPLRARRAPAPDDSAGAMCSHPALHCGRVAANESLIEEINAAGLRKTAKQAGLDRKTIRGIIQRKRVKASTLAKVLVGMRET